MARTHKARRAAQARKAKELKTRVEAYVLAHGGGDHRFYDFVLPTGLGNLLVSVHDHDTSVYGRFEEVDRAVSKLGRNAMNPHSGKWNMHPPDDWSVDDVFDEWTRSIENLPFAPVVAS